MNDTENLAIYQTKEGALELKADIANETLWASQAQIALIFEVNSQAITKHIRNVYLDKELDEKSTCSILEQVQKEGQRNVKRKVKIYNLDVLIAIGYRINSIKATKFRIWATKTLKQHITQGFTINREKIEQNKATFLQTIEDLKILAKDNQQLNAEGILELIKSFSNAWFALESYAKNKFPTQGTKKEILITDRALQEDLKKLKQALIDKREATQLFAQEKKQDNLQGIVGNVFQSVFGQDAYETVEKKAAHLMYFIIKNHPFNDDNKRSGAFAFIWFLQKAGYHFKEKITPETLTALTILIVESHPKEKQKMIGIILLLLHFENEKPIQNKQ